MKKINFFIILLTIASSINSFIYIDIIVPLIPKTVGLYVDKVTNDNVLWNTIQIVIINIIPSFIIAYLYLKVKKSKLWIIPIFLLYSLFWFYTSYSIMHIYIQHFGHTWLDIEVFNFMLQQKHFYIAYLLSLIPMVFLIFYNKRSNL